MAYDATINETFHRERLGGKQHFLAERYTAGVEEVLNSGYVVGHSKFRRRNGECAVVCRDDEVATHDEFAGSAPHTSLYHGNHGRREKLDGPDDAPSRIVVGHGVASIGRQLANIVARRKHLGTRRSSQDDISNLLLPHFLKSSAKVI